jgi:tRNA guanosine-2'-O-methyltransferase
MAEEEFVLVQLILDHPDEAAVNTKIHQISKFQQHGLDSFWSSSSILIDQEETKLYRLWLQWVLPSQSTKLPVQLLRRNIYFLLLLRGLCSRSSERIKLCLFILRQSIRLAKSGIDTDVLSFTQSNYESTQLAVEKYCSIFETIVLGRYSNQVEECMKLLPESCLQIRETVAELFELHSSWWIALFTATLGLENAHNIQKIIGGYILAQDFSALDYSEHLGRFLAGPLLQWACRGTLFTTTMRRTRQNIRCEHGSRLSQFLNSVIRNSANSHVRTCFTRIILHNLREYKASPHAISFIIQGLNIYSLQHAEDRTSSFDTAVQERQYEDSKGWMSIAKVSLLTSLCKSSQFTIHLRTICDYHLNVILTMTDSFGFFNIAPPPTAFPNAPEESPKLGEFSDIHSFATFLADPKNDMALAASKLDRAVDQLSNLIRSQEDDILRSSSLQSDVLTALEKIWSQSERQRHRKYVLESIPSILYENTILQIAVINNNFKSFLSQCLIKLLKLAHTRIYIWNPLARAVRISYFQMPYLSKILPLQEFLEEFARNPPVPTLSHLLDCAVSQGLSDYIGTQEMIWNADEGYGHACIFDIMNRFMEHDFDMGKSIISTLLDPWHASKTLSGSTAFPTEISILQAVLILAGKCVKTKEDIDKLRKDVMTSLGLGVDPSARYLFQWMIVASYWTVPNDLVSIDSLNTFLELLRNPVDENISSKIVVSFLRIGLCIASHPDVTPQFIEELMCILPTFGSYDKVAIRHEGQWTIPKLMSIAALKNIVSVSKNKSYIFLDRYIRSLRNYQNPPAIWKMEEFIPERHQNLTMLFEGAYLQLISNIWNGPSANDFQKIYEEDARAPQLELPDPYLRQGESVTYEAPQRQTRKQVADQESATHSMPLQLKSALSLDVAVSSEQEEEVASLKSNSILVASLIDSPYNLGGLSRVAEIYGCAEFHISDMSVIKNNAFTTTSMSSEAHLNIIQTPLSDLVAVLRVMKSKGWTILGIEQTDSSLILGEESTKLPLKAVIVMGAEKTGIPADVLFVCDKFIELKQWGVTRSLNVQTAAATVLYEYRRQWRDLSVENNI